MANYIKTLKEDNGDVTYPVTKAGAVYLNNGTDAESKFADCVTADEIAVTSAMAKAVTLKNGNDEIIYPVTNIDSVNGDIPTSKIADSAITSSKLASNSVTNSKILDGTISDSKLDYSTFGAVWSGFCITDPDLSGEFQLITKKGTVLTCITGNGSTHFRIIAGGENINVVRQYWGAHYSTAIGGEFGVHGLASGSKCYCRYYGAIMSSSTANAGENVQIASTGVDGNCFTSLAATGSQTRDGTRCELTCLRLYPGGNAWSMNGKISCNGVRMSMSFEAECTSADGFIPTTYQRGATSSNVGSIYNYLEVLEV